MLSVLSLFSSVLPTTIFTARTETPTTHTFTEADIQDIQTEFRRYPALAKHTLKPLTMDRMTETQLESAVKEALSAVGLCGLLRTARATEQGIDAEVISKIEGIATGVLDTLETWYLDGEETKADWEALKKRVQV